MSIQAYRAMSLAELNKELFELKREVLSLRIQQGVSQQASKPHLFKKARRKIAQVATVLREKAQNG